MYERPSQPKDFNTFPLHTSIFSLPHIYLTLSDKVLELYELISLQEKNDIIDAYMHYKYYYVL